MNKQEMINVIKDMKPIKNRLSGYPELRYHYKCGHNDAIKSVLQIIVNYENDEINRLKGLIEEHNNQLHCDKNRCGYAPYKRDCPDCPKQWMIEL